MPDATRLRDALLRPAGASSDFDLNPATQLLSLERLTPTLFIRKHISVDLVILFGRDPALPLHAAYTIDSTKYVYMYKLCSSLLRSIYRS